MTKKRLGVLVLLLCLGCGAGLEPEPQVTRSGKADDPSAAISAAPPINLVAVDIEQTPNFIIGFHEWKRALGDKAEPVWLNANGDIFTNLSLIIRGTNGRPIRRLVIVDHGNEEGQELGLGWIGDYELSLRIVREKLQQLKMAPDGALVLAGCDVGNAATVMLTLADIVGADVYAGTGLNYYAWIHEDEWFSARSGVKYSVTYNTGNWMVAHPGASKLERAPQNYTGRGNVLVLPN
jgi:hypothetical protein